MYNTRFEGRMGALAVCMEIIALTPIPLEFNDMFAKVM